MAYLNDLKTKKYPSITAFGGINTGVSPFNIADSEASDMLNLSSGEYPAIVPSKMAAEDVWQAAEKVYYMGTLFTGVPFIVAEIGGVTDIFYLDGEFKGMGAADKISAFTHFDSTNFSDKKTILATGKKLIEITMDGSTYKTSEIKSTEAMPQSVEFVISKDERLLTASSRNDVFGASEYQAVQYVNADDFQLFYVRTEAERYASALGVYNDLAIYFKRNSTHILYGKNPDSYSFDTLSHSVGCIAHKSVAETEKGIMWLGEDGVYQYSATTLPYKVSTPVEKYIGNMREGAAAVSDGRKYYLSLPQKEGAVLLVYDTEFKVWHVEENCGYKNFLYYEGSIIACDGARFYRLGEGKAAKEWHFTSKPFDLGGVSGKVNLYRIYLNLRAEKGSNIKVSLSGSAEGENFKTLARKSYLKDTDEKLRIDITPDKKVRDLPYFRLKISGGGDMKIYGLEANLRVKGRSY